METTPDGNIKGLTNIKKIVVLMFENRSFDHVFGAFPGVNGLMRDGEINQDYYNLPDPLQPPSPTNLRVYPAPVDAALPLGQDFTHDFGDGMVPDLFGPIFKTTPSNATPTTQNACYYSGYAKGWPLHQANPGQTTYPSTNSGFYTTYNTNAQQGQAVLTYFERDALKVLPALANNFVLCDKWFCDMPGHTLPNRAFMHCGTTGDAGIDDTDGGKVDDKQSGEVKYDTIFDRIDQSFPHNWKMYAPVAFTKKPDGSTERKKGLGQLDTRFLNKNVFNYRGVPITEFAVDCAAGTLPFYSFIMCWLPDGTHTHWTDTTMHPSSMLQPGENFLAAVYNTLRNSPSWDETLLVVTFDENGGIYDHVMPPETTPPDDRGLITAAPNQGACNNSWTLMSQFDFSLLGPRVPALLISPWLHAGIDSHQYQNTSILRFLIDKLNSETPQGIFVPYFTERDKNAPDLKSAFLRFGTDKMRDDCPDWIEPYRELPSKDPSTDSYAIPYSEGQLTVWDPPPKTEDAPPVSYTRELLSMYVSSLPGHADSGEPITRTFATNADVASYVQERMDAAERFCASSP